eukprot:TRINITY_DN8576_c0_g2_i1.p1 TRINITY_DN8576_c0_g2~~TRINITY_DN8576_c0_g2_i1.p1  ORF type:complete len:224 (-),score=21.52 TRINITY_DN8576_c0_g2_i1:82-753(-)
MANNVIKLYHIPGWRSTRPVWLYKELADLYPNDQSRPELVVHLFDARTFKTNKPDWFLELNPNGKLPFMQHGPQIEMFDSVAICLYLRRFDLSHQLFLDDPLWEAMFYQFSFYCSNTVDVLTARSSFVQSVVNDSRYAFKDDYELHHRAWSLLCGPMISQLLGEKKYFWGDTFTAIDVIMGCNILWLNEKVDWLKEFPNLLPYYYRIKERPAFQYAWPIETRL